MSDHDALNVWNGQRLVGRLRRDSFGHISFRYEPGWISGGGFAVSQALPLRYEEYKSEEGIAHRFFANLLPEGGFRERTVRDLKVSDTDFNLLRAIGGECAGALSILPEQLEPSAEHSYRPINDEELADLVSQRGQPYSWSAGKRPRFSLAGAQNKFPVLMRDGRHLLPQGESPSSHILKFEVAEHRNVPAYETFTTLLAGAAGLPVVDIRLESINKTRYTITKRYDRFSGDDGDVTRTHQEDFCQALGYGHEKKIPGRRRTVLRAVLPDASGRIERPGDGPSAFAAMADFQRACGQFRRPCQESIASLYGKRRGAAGVFLRSCVHPGHRKNRPLSGVISGRRKKSRDNRQTPLERHGRAVRHPTPAPA